MVAHSQATVDEYAAGLAAYVQASPSSYHATEEAARQLSDAGFMRLDEADAWPVLESGAGAYVVRDGAVIAWRPGAGVTGTSPVRVLGAHTDSPTFKLKPEPGFTTEGWAQVGVEIYGGPLLNSWLDRDLEIAGRLVLRDGSVRLARTGAIARIPQLAIHLDRQVNAQGLVLDRQKHTQPILGATLEDGAGDPRDLLARAADVSRDDIAGSDLVLCDTQAPARIGADGQLLASGRLDNLSSVYAGLHALLQATPAPGTISMLAAFDHEELGSDSRSGASGPFLEDVLARLYESLGASAEDRARAMHASWCLSADAGHSVHPNYPEVHDPKVRPIMGAGPMLKVNATQRYASDAHGEALWNGLCERADVPTQTFVSNNQIPCGSTIGPITATRLGIRTVDVGVPLLSMHSVRELAHVADLHQLAVVTDTFFTTGNLVDSP